MCGTVSSCHLNGLYLLNDHPYAAYPSQGNGNNPVDIERPISVFRLQHAITAWLNPAKPKGVSVNAAYHKLYCADCGRLDIHTQEEHTFYNAGGNTQKCSLCGYINGSSPN